MRQSIRYEGLMNMFGYGMVSPDYLKVYFPEKVLASRVINFLGITGLIPNLKLSNIEESELPAIAQRYGQTSAVTAKLDAVGRGVNADIEVAKALENKFNPVAQSWRANFAGTHAGNPQSALYVVTQSNDYLFNYLGQNDDIDDINSVAGLGYLHFELRGRESEMDAVTSFLPHDYFAYITAFTKREFDFVPR